jgi:hypothetical protein
METIAMAAANARPIPVPFARDGRNEQHMNAISKNERQLGQKKCKYTASIPPASAISP